MVRAMRIALRSRLSPIWGQKQFVRFWLGESISMIGSGVSTFAVPLVAVITLRASPSQMGVLSAVGAAPGILLGLFAGVWVDRVSRQRLLIATELIAAALVASVPVSYALGSLSFAQLFGVALGFGILGPFWWPSWNAFLPSVVEPGLLFEANSKLVFSASSLSSYRSSARRSRSCSTRDPSSFPPPSSRPFGRGSRSGPEPTKAGRCSLASRTGCA